MRLPAARSLACACAFSLTTACSISVYQRKVLAALAALLDLQRPSYLTPGCWLPAACHSKPCAEPLRTRPRRPFSHGGLVDHPTTGSIPALVRLKPSADLLGPLRRLYNLILLWRQALQPLLQASRAFGHCAQASRRLPGPLQHHLPGLGP